jgi:hypothetical protein
MFMICSSSYFKTNFSAHSIHTRHKNNLHKPLVKFTSQQGDTTFSVIKVFNKLPWDITQFQHDKIQFKIAFKKYLLTTLIYSVDKFLVFQ